MINVEVRPQDLRTLEIRLARAKDAVAGKGLRNGIHAAILHLQRHIKMNLLSGQMVNVRTGNLRRALFAEMVNDRTGRLGIGREAPYAVFVHEGTKPHVIEAKNAKALRFAIGGETVFAKRVNHPGTSPRPFMRDGLEQSKDDIRRIIAQRINAAMKGRR